MILGPWLVPAAGTPDFLEGTRLKRLTSPEGELGGFLDNSGFLCSTSSESSDSSRLSQEGISFRTKARFFNFSYCCFLRAPASWRMVLSSGLRLSLPLFLTEFPIMLAPIFPPWLSWRALLALSDLFLNES